MTLAELRAALGALPPTLPDDTPVLVVAGAHHDYGLAELTEVDLTVADTTDRHRSWWQYADRHNCHAESVVVLG